MEQLKFCSIMQFDVKGYGTIRPVEQDAKWGEKALRSKKKGRGGYADYLLINSFTDKGLDKIADYNNYREEWDSEKEQFTEGTPMYQKRFVNFKLYGSLKDTASLKIQHFTDAGLGLKDATRKPIKMNEQILADYMKEV